MVSKRMLKKITTVALLLSLFVVMLGAYTRLTNAGLGCPDWPGCYGRMTVASVNHDDVQTHYPDSPFESRKAWTEMLHRYAAGTLVLLVLVINGCIYRLNRKQAKPLSLLPLVILGLLLFQALLGMWTVTLKLLPLVVMGHLLGGILIFSCLCTLRMQLSDSKGFSALEWRPWIFLGLVLVFCQIALGGWVSSNYAGVSCIGFPQCNGSWWPSMNFSRAFNLFLPIGANYQGGVLDAEARVTIQFVHRLGALVVAGVVLTLAGFLLLRIRQGALRVAAYCAIALVLAQLMLGILNVVYLLPLSVAVLHNGVAAMLLALFFVMFNLVSGDARARVC